MRRATVILTLLLVSSLLFVAPSIAQQGPSDDAAAPDSVRQAAAAQFRADHGTNWRVRWHASAGVPATLMGGEVRGYSGPPTEAGRAFLRDHKKLFGIENARRGLEVARQNASRASARVLYQQIHQGVPVLNSGYLVAVDESGAVYYVSGDYYPDLKVPTISPSLSEQAVVRRMRSDLGSGTGFEVLQKPRLSIYVEEERADSTLSYHLAYEAESKQREPLKAFRYVIDARSGDVLDKNSLIERAIEHDSGRSRGAVASDRGSSSGGGSAMVSGSGEVYTTNPEVQTSPTTVTLNRLRSLSPRRLDGDNVVVQDEYGDNATSSSGEFDYSTSNHYFDQVMVYYHSDEFEEWLQGRGLGGSRVGKVTAETRSINDYAAALPSQRLAFYSDGSSYPEENPTREGSVIAHEQMHIVSETYEDLDNDDAAEAMDEAYSDFFAAAYRHAKHGGQSTLVGQYAFSTVDTHRDVDNDFDDRDADNDNDDTPDTIYDASLVLSGALWDFKQSVGTELAAELTLASLAHLDADPSFWDARNALITAASNAGYPGYECLILSTFEDHGIGKSCLQQATLNGPEVVGTNQFASWSVDITGGKGPFTIDWYDEPSMPIDEPPESTDLDPADDVYAKYTGGTSDDFYLQATVTDDRGDTASTLPYFIDVQSGSTCPSGEECTNSLAASPPAAAVPDTFSLGGSAPNPAQRQTTIRYAVPEAADVTLTVHDVVGRRIARLIDSRKAAGFHEASFDASDLPSGVYFYRLRAGTFTETKQLVVVK